MKRTVLICLLLFCAVLLFAARASGFRDEYREEALIGKTSAEIEGEYGAFDCVGMPEGEDGLYRNTRCGYTIRAAKRGFLGASDEVLLFIVFDENGVAAACEEGHRPGG